MLQHLFPVFAGFVVSLRVEFRLIFYEVWHYKFRRSELCLWGNIRWHHKTFLCDFGPFDGEQEEEFQWICFWIISELTCTFLCIYISACFLCLTVVMALGTSGRAALQCPVCPRTFVSKANLLVHAKNEHGDDRGPFSCSICGRIAKNKNSLRVHVYLYHRKNWKNEKQHCFTDLHHYYQRNFLIHMCINNRPYPFSW
jgi:hypothetical protein